MLFSGEVSINEHQISSAGTTSKKNTHKAAESSSSKWKTCQNDDGDDALDDTHGTELHNTQRGVA